MPAAVVARPVVERGVTVFRVQEITELVEGEYPRAHGEMMAYDDVVAVVIEIAAHRLDEPDNAPADADHRTVPLLTARWLKANENSGGYYLFKNRERKMIRKRTEGWRELIFFHKNTPFKH